MSQRFTLASSNRLTLCLIVSLVLVCAMSAAAAAEELLSRSPERGGIGLDLQQLQFDEKFSTSGKHVREGLLNKLDERLSIIVTDKASTSAITFSEVMDNLAADMAADMHVDKKLLLFQRWWDTANSRKNKATDVYNDVLCDSEGEPSDSGLSTKNGFVYQCPRAEGEQARTNPFTAENEPSNPKWEEAYTAIAFVNRFDLADKHSGRHCGEFRIVFARNSGFTQTDKRNLIIFEALVLNPSRDPPVDPTPEKLFANLEGCRPIVEFWLSLSNPDMTTAARGRALHDFFLKGLPKDNIGPIVDARHYAGGPDSGQIRTNQFMGGRWTLREFKTYRGSIVPATVKSNPGNDLFSSFASEDSRKQELEDYLVTKDALDSIRGVKGQMDAAGERSLFTFAFGLTTTELDRLNSFDSMAQSPTHGNVVEAFDNCLGSTRCPLKDRVEAALKDAGSPLNANNIMHRIGTQTCAGCHRYSNGDKELAVDCPEVWPDRLCFIAKESGVEVHRGIWPSTLPDGDGFTHVSENDPGEGGTDKDVFDLADLPDGIITLDALRGIRSKRIGHLSYMGPDGCHSRYKISETLKLVLMPPRFENMVLYLNDPP